MIVTIVAVLTAGVLGPLGAGSGGMPGYKCTTAGYISWGCSTDPLNCSGTCTADVFTAPVTMCYFTDDWLDSCSQYPYFYSPPVYDYHYDNGYCTDQSSYGPPDTCLCQPEPPAEYYAQVGWRCDLPE
jgi:hypothetical protein